MKKIVIAIVLLLTGSCFVIPCEAKIHKGKTKEGVTYQYNTKSKTLTMSGTIIKGNLKNPQKVPWQKWWRSAKKIVLKRGVGAIEEGAFDNFQKAEKIKLPKTLEIIGLQTFNRTNIKKLLLPDSVREIKKFAFSSQPYQGSIQEIKLSHNLKKIGADAFSCQAIRSIKFPSNVTSIGAHAFEECADLKTIIIKSKKLKEIGKRAFSYIARDAVIYVPKEKIKKYEKLLQKSNTYGEKLDIRPIKGV